MTAKLPRTMVSDLAGAVGRRVRVCGWVDAVRAASDPEGSSVVVLRDRSGQAPLVLAGRDAPAREEAVDAVGTVVPGGGDDDVGPVVVMVDDLAVRGRVLDELPVDARSPVEERLDWRFLDLRRPENLMVFEVQTTAERAMREHWAAHGFLELHSPKLRPNPNRSGRELFALPYFGGQAYLAQSPQFYKQMAMAAGFERVFEVGPVFRANPLVTARHDTEFTSVDVEMSWVESHEEVMAFQEGWLRHMVAAVAEAHGDDVARRFGVEIVVPEVPFPRVPLREARRIAEASGPDLAQPPGDLDARGERVVGEHVARERGHQLVFVTEYPAETRPFYHMRLDDRSELTRSFDLLWNGIEVTTGAQREHRYDRLLAQARDKGVALDPIRYYLDCFRFGCPPHGGFGLGLTRMLMALLRRDDVREVTFLHRGPHRLCP